MFTRHPVVTTGTLPATTTDTNHLPVSVFCCLQPMIKTSQPLQTKTRFILLLRFPCSERATPFLETDSQTGCTRVFTALIPIIGNQPLSHPINTNLKHQSKQQIEILTNGFWVFDVYINMEEETDTKYNSNTSYLFIA